MIHPLLLAAAVFFFGAILGSFLNVCILRIPLGQSIVNPPSRCAACGRRLPLGVNLPIVGYFILRGRAHCCGAHLDSRYPLVEAGTATALTALWLLYPPHLFAIYALLVAGLIVASGIDLDYLVIPDALTIGGVVVGISLSYLVPSLQGKEDPVDAMIRSSLSAAVDQSPSGWNGVGPRFAHGARPAAGVGTPSVNLSIHNLNRIDRFSLKGGWVVNLRQSEHLYFVRQSAVPTVESCLDK